MNDSTMQHSAHSAQACPGAFLSRRAMAWAVALMAAMFTCSAHATRLGDLVEVQGARGNLLKGIGIVVGLAGTGDSARNTIISQERMLERLGIDVKDVKELSSKNSAIVIVTAELPAFAKEGTQLDVKVDSLYDCESLEGGQLMETHLYGPGDNTTVYAVAQGPVSVGGFNADASGGTKVRKNHVTAGRIPMGAFVEREAPSRITDGERITLLLKRPDFATASAIQRAINSAYSMEVARALGGGTINVRIPDGEQGDLVSFISHLQAMDINTPAPTNVVINERTGTIVMGGNVMIKPCQVAHGSLTITIANTPQVSQPNPFGQGQTVVTNTQDLGAVEEEAYLMPVQGTSAVEVADALNKLRVTPRDMISIFQALRTAGALEADIEVM
jgi:flagellar P-ring protein precursor FlgI